MSADSKDIHPILEECRKLEDSCRALEEVRIRLAQQGSENAWAEKICGDVIAQLTQATEALSVWGSEEHASENLDRELDRQIDIFLLQLDRKIQLRRATVAKNALRFLLLERGDSTSMKGMYNAVAERMETTYPSVERCLRSFKEAAVQNNTPFFEKHFGGMDHTNGSFYWKAMHLLRESLNWQLQEYIQR